MHFKFNCIADDRVISDCRNIVHGDVYFPAMHVKVSICGSTAHTHLRLDNTRKYTDSRLHQMKKKLQEKQKLPLKLTQICRNQTVNISSLHS